MDEFLINVLNKTIGEHLGLYGKNGINNTIKTQTILIILMITLHLLASIKFIIKKYKKWKNKAANETTDANLSNII